ncbi:hypothetical protein DFH09DRAFT_1108230 [Mycena vulgaris]|nr:hypothetical protein DFH09DRAFT_1108230 [Mycena vulgaris]
MSSTAVTADHYIIYALRLRNYSDGDENTHKPVSRLSEQTGLPSRQTGLQADLPGLGFDLHPNPSPSPNKPVGAGASPFGKPKSELSLASSSTWRYCCLPASSPDLLRRKNFRRRLGPSESYIFDSLQIAEGIGGETV